MALPPPKKNLARGRWSLGGGGRAGGLPAPPGCCTLGGVGGREPLGTCPAPSWGLPSATALTFLLPPPSSSSHC